MRNYLNIFLLFFIAVIIFSGVLSAQVPIGIIHSSNNNSNFEKEFVSNIVDVIEQRENLEYLETHNDEQLILIINTFSNEDVILYDVTYIYSLENSVISYFISKYTGADNKKTVEDTPEKIISDMEVNFLGWLNYMSN